MTVDIYRSDNKVKALDNPLTLSGEDILSGFMLDLSSVW